MKPTLLFKNGVIRTFDDRDTVASAMATQGKRILWIGDESDAPPGAGKVIDLEGRPILPGFTDSHAHLVA